MLRHLQSALRAAVSSATKSVPVLANVTIISAVTGLAATQGYQFLSSKSETPPALEDTQASPQESLSPGVSGNRAPASVRAQAPNQTYSAEPPISEARRESQESFAATEQTNASFVPGPLQNNSSPPISAGSSAIPRQNTSKPSGEAAPEVTNVGLKPLSTSENAVTPATQNTSTASVLQVVAGDQQTGTVGLELGTSLAVKVLDASGNPVSGAAVRWSISSGGGSLGSSLVTSSATGISSNTLTIGNTAGANTVTAQISTGASVTFSATGVAGSFAGYSFSGITSASAGTAGSFTLTAIDSHGNTVSAYTGTATFTSSDGSSTLPADYTFVAGDASSHSFSVTFSTPGLQTITATQGTIASSSSEIPVYPKVVLTGPATVPIGSCSPSFTITTKNGSNVTANAGTSSAVSLSAETAGTFYSDSACSTSISTVTIAASSSTGTFYFRTTSPNTQNITTTLSSSSSYVALRSSTNLFAGAEHACLVLRNRTMKCWGYNNKGQLGDGTTTDRYTAVAVSALSNVTSAASSMASNHSCAVLGDGTMRCWGGNASGQLGDATTTDRSSPVTVSGISTAIAAATGSLSTCALLADGTVKCWGANTLGQLGDGTTTNRTTPTLVTGISNAVAISLGSVHGCAVLASGGVKCWGRNNGGQLGNNSTTDSTTPVSVSGISSAVEVAGSLTHSCARLSTGSVNCWGTNTYGNLGDGTNTQRLTPVQVSGISNAVSITVSSYETCAVLSTGAAKCWGYSVLGGLGIADPTINVSYTPVSVLGISNAIGIAAGDDSFGCVSLSDNTASCWGYSRFGGTGKGVVSIQNTPVSLTLTGISDIEAGYTHACALLSSGGISCWGLNVYGNLGNGTLTSSTSPVTVSGITNAVSLSGGGLGYHSCALLNDNTVKCWGRNSYGQLGDGTSTIRSTPVTVAGLTNATSVASGWMHTCALRSTGSVSCVGYNGYGQLGDGTTTSRTSLANVTGITTATSVATSFGHTCARLSDGSVACWGYNPYGALGNGSTTNSSSPVAVSGISTATSVAAGYYHSCAVLSDGSVRCWGYNGQGQLGNNSTTNSSTPVTVSGISTAVSVTTAQNHSCALLSDGTIKCWGRGATGQLGQGAFVASNTPVSVTGITTGSIIRANYEYSCALLSNNSAKCWGMNVFDVFGLGNSSFLVPSPVLGIP